MSVPGTLAEKSLGRFVARGSCRIISEARSQAFSQSSRLLGLPCSWARSRSTVIGVEALCSRAEASIQPGPNLSSLLFARLGIRLAYSVPN